PRADAVRKDVGDKETEVVPGRGVSRPGVAEADQKLRAPPPRRAGGWFGHAVLLRFPGGRLFGGLALALGGFLALGSFGFLAGRLAPHLLLTPSTEPGDQQHLPVPHT